MGPSGRYRDMNEEKAASAVATHEACLPSDSVLLQTENGGSSGGMGVRR
jgi:hypothetical protein